MMEMLMHRSMQLVLVTLVAGACTSNSVSPPSLTAADEAVVAQIKTAAKPITGAASDYDELMGLIGDARVVLLGESTHGTHEFFVERARITERLVREKGFTAIAVEGDWPDAYR